MLDNERSILKQNAEVLANLLTENVPYLLSNYLQNGVLTEAEREEIISENSAHEIKIKLLEILADKESVSIQSVIEGLNATENHCVSKEINNLLSGKSEFSQEEDVDAAGGDQLADVSAYATNIVDEVIATAEESPLLREDNSHQDSEEEIEDKPTVEATVEVHAPKQEDISEDEWQDETPAEDAVDKNVSFPDKFIATVIDDGKSNEEPEQSVEKVEEYHQSQGVDAQPSENEDDQIDIEKEFSMPSEANNNNDQNKEQQSGRVLTRMESNEIILDNSQDADSAESEAAIARRNLVKQHVERLEKTSPTTGGVAPGKTSKVQYSFRSSAKEQEQVKGDEQGTNVKNLKNFFQRLSTTESQAAPPSAAVKPVGKLKVTFPAS